MTTPEERAFSEDVSPEQVELNKAWMQNQGASDFRQVEIVPTTRANYITGVYALNIPDEEGTNGDWHPGVFWLPKNTHALGKISLSSHAAFDTNSIYGELGVQEARERVTGIGLHVAEEIKEVYVANHMRATLDLVYSELYRYGEVRYAIGGSVDWLDTPEQQATLLDHAAKLGGLLIDSQIEELDRWINNESNLV